MIKQRQVLRSANKRVQLIDEVRGFSIIMMVVYHFFYDLVVVFGVRIDLFYSPVIQQLVAIFGGVFVFISGSACLFSRNNLKRGLICFCLGLAVTGVTYLALPESIALFGVLHMLGICMMLFSLISPLIKRINPYIGILVCMLLFFFTYTTQSGYLELFGLFHIELPSVLYTTPYLFWLGFVSPTFFSSDFFPLLPWFFCFTAGSFFGVLVKERRLPELFYIRGKATPLRALSFVGRHTLIVYILHQPIVYVILAFCFPS